MSVHLTHCRFLCRESSAYFHIHFTFHEHIQPLDHHLTRNLKESKLRPRPFTYMAKAELSSMWTITENVLSRVHLTTMTKDCHICNNTFECTWYTYDVEQMKEHNVFQSQTFPLPKAVHHSTNNLPYV